MSKGLQYKHYFIVTDGKFQWEDPKMFAYAKTQLEGKKGYAIIEEEVDPVTPNQWAYYYGGIIREECMKSNQFAGLSEKDIHMYLLRELRTHHIAVTLPDSSTRTLEVVDDYHSWNKKDMAAFVDEVIAFLQVTHDIHPKPPDSYKYNKYHHKIKIHGME